jgi:trehalose utilization protein
MIHADAVHDVCFVASAAVPGGFAGSKNAAAFWGNAKLHRRAETHWFLMGLLLFANFGLGAVSSGKETEKAIHVVVWDEQQPTQKVAYPNFLGNYLADQLKSRPGLEVRSVRLDDPEHGLSKETLDWCDVLIYWDHARHKEMPMEKAREVAGRIKSGQLSLIALHSAHWSRPFVEAMQEVARERARAAWKGADEKVEFEFIAPPEFVSPKADTALTPRYAVHKYPGGLTKVAVHLPNCAFPAWEEHGKPSFVTTLRPEHPIAKGIPKQFEIRATEMYDEPFHVPDPDEVVFEERWQSGDWFRCGCVWNLGKGRVFYFRPGHETYPIFKETAPQQIVENAVRWLGSEKTGGR